MDVPARRQDSGSAAEPEEPDPVVTSHETRPGNYVFTERGNSDGWIASDVAVDVER